MGDFGSAITSGLSGLSSMFGGGGTSGGGTFGTDQFGNPTVSGSPLDSFFGMSDPTGTMGATFSQSYGGDGGSGLPFASTGGGDGGGGDQSQQPASEAQQAPSSMAPANYQPAPGPATQQADPASWQIGGAGRSLGPTGFVQQQTQAIPWASAPQSWVQSTGVPTNLTSGGFSDTFDQRFPGAGGTTVVAKDQSGDQTGQTADQGGQSADQGGASADQGGPTVANTVASAQAAPPAAVDQAGAPSATEASSAPADTSQVDQQQGGGGPRGGGGGGGQQPGQMPDFGRGPPGMQSMGNLFRDIQGLMSGNPASLMNLVGDVMRMMGGGGMPGMPGGGMGMPGMGGALGQIAQQGPYAGQPIQNIPWAPGYNPQTGQWSSPQARQSALQQIAQGRGGPNPGQAPRAGQRPGQQPGESFEDAQNRTRGPAAAAAAGAAAPAAGNVGPTGTGAAAQPLQSHEVQTPSGRTAPMKPTQGSVDRSRFANENNPAMIERAAWMVKGELGGNASTRQKIVQLETAFNRAQYRGHSLGQALLDTRSGSQGYYDGNSAHPTYRVSAKPTPQEVAQFKREVWDPVMKGSNLSDIGYGPMTGNASQDLAGRQMQRMHGYTMQTGESYFREGPFRSPLPALPQQAAAPSPWGDPRVTRLPQQLAG
jgi:hypothetical protein